MTDDDDLRARLAALDPVRRDPGLRSLPEPTPAEIQEHVMHAMDHNTIDETTTDLPADRPAPHRGLRSPFAVAAGVIAVAVLAGGGYVAAGLGKGNGTVSAVSSPRSTPATTLALKAGGGGVGAMCMRFDPALLKAMPVAFLGTVVSSAGEVVTLHVDTWYVGGTQDQVTVTSPGGPSGGALDGVDFSGGGSFLVTATDGTVNGCGYSGPASPELEKVYTDAFAR